MSEPVTTPQEPAAPLSFDKVELDGARAATTCAKCQQQIDDSYFEVNGLVVCPACHDEFVALHTGGSGARRFRRALLWGSAGAIAGAAAWMAVTRLTGYEIGFVAIIVGLLVGHGVKKGADGRGGILYQLLAVFLTYLAIVSTYVPYVVEGMNDAERRQIAANANGAGSNNAVADENATAAESEVPTWIAFIVYVTIVFGVSFAAPFLLGIENVLGIAIIGFALWQAWKANRRVPLAISGPLRIAAPTLAPRAQ